VNPQVGKPALREVDSISVCGFSLGSGCISGRIKIVQKAVKSMVALFQSAARVRVITHVHLSETQGYEHTNSIIGTGTVDFASYVHKAVELGIEENCKRVSEPCIAGIEMGEPHYPVDNPDRWMQQSLTWLSKHLPELSQ
jgi:hypothetical protein